MPPTFVLLRHGEAEHNVGFRERGESAYEDPAYRDSALTEKGIQQAKDARDALSHLSFLAVWSSPLSRCIQTATYANNGNGVMYLHDSLLERLGGGHICNERKTKAEINANYPDCTTIFLPDSPPAWSEREGRSSVFCRAFGLIEFLKYIYSDKTREDHVLVVTHHDWIEILTKESVKNCEHVFLR
jgi:broad specificity phosphatase PhoE